MPSQEPMPEAVFPGGREPLGERTFRFACHAGLSCFTRCCRNVDMFLYPYDILRLKKRLGIDSEEFLERYARFVEGSNPYFPAVMMRMRDTGDRPCPFLAESGCTVYEDRPSACRTYPLERAVDRRFVRGRPREFYFLTNHPYCLGHGEGREWKVRDWLRDQGLLYANHMDDLWAEMDTLFAANPWEGEGVDGPRRRLAVMICYNIDGFRRYVEAHRVLDRFRLPSSRLRDIRRDDEALLRFGYDWLKFLLAGQPTLRPRR